MAEEKIAELSKENQVNDVTAPKEQKTYSLESILCRQNIPACVDGSVNTICHVITSICHAMLVEIECICS